MIHYIGDVNRVTAEPKTAMGNALSAGEAREEFRRLYNASSRIERELIEAKYKLQV